ncbi:hypothetical protein Tco_0568439 [Tanacetum coccineum]
MEHEVKRGNKVVKKELIVALRGEFYFVKFIINPEEGCVDLEFFLERSFYAMMTKAITDFEVGTVTIYPEIDPFLEDIKEEEKSLDDWDHMLDFNLDDVPPLGEEELPPFVCKMGKSGRLINIIGDPGRISKLWGRSGSIVNTPERLFSTFDGFCHQTFRAARSDVMRNAESDSDDEEEYQIRGNQVMGCDGEIDDMFRIKLREAKSNEEIFTSVAWIRAFNINEPIYAELCHEFYSTYEFDEFCADDELQTKKIIKFRLGGRAYSLTLLEFTRRLGLYHADELEEDGFNVYFEGGLRSDEHFNAQEY